MPDLSIVIVSWNVRDSLHDSAMIMPKHDDVGAGEFLVGGTGALMPQGNRIGIGHLMNQPDGLAVDRQDVFPPDAGVCQYLAGTRAKPVWGISTADFHKEGGAGEILGNFPTIFLVRERTRKEILFAMRMGRMYACRGRFPQE